MNLITAYTHNRNQTTPPSFTRSSFIQRRVDPLDRRLELTRLRGQLAELVRSGLKKEDAYKTLTLHPARLLGLEERLGSIEKGRDADLVFFDGDPLDPHTTVQRVMILGKTVYNVDEDE